jgi:hypothetical protein
MTPLRELQAVIGVYSDAILTFHGLVTLGSDELRQLRRTPAAKPPTILPNMRARFDLQYPPDVPLVRLPLREQFTVKPDTTGLTGPNLTDEGNHVFDGMFLQQDLLLGHGEGVALGTNMYITVRRMNLRRGSAEVLFETAEVGEPLVLHGKIYYQRVEEFKSALQTFPKGSTVYWVENSAVWRGRVREVVFPETVHAKIAVDVAQTARIAQPDPGDWIAGEPKCKRVPAKNLHVNMADVIQPVRA